jgi:uncharacterized protein YndB with AHSA1/START domain
MKKIFFGILGLVTIIVIILLVVGWTNPEFQYGNSITIQRPPATCYNMLTDTMQMKKWMPGFRSQKLLEGDHRRPGAEYEFIVEDGELMTMRQRVTEWNAPEKVAYVLTNDVLISSYSYTLKGDSTQTQLTTSYTVEGNNVFMKAILYFSKSVLMQADLEALHSLKAEAESSRQN